MDDSLIRFGRRIDQTTADRLFKNLILIKQACSGIIRKALNGKAAAIRFYCGRAESDPICEDQAYIFDVASVKKILSIIENQNGNGMVIFHGVRNKEDNQLEDGTFNDVDGRPTLMLFACKYNFTKKDGVDELQIVNLLGEGEEHPGTGGSRNIDANNPRLPSSFDHGEWHPIR